MFYKVCCRQSVKLKVRRSVPQSHGCADLQIQSAAWATTKPGENGVVIALLHGEHPKKRKIILTLMKM
jgi:hypothetical protein